jgi:hypothetical protein
MDVSPNGEGINLNAFDCLSIWSLISTLHEDIFEMTIWITLE